MRFPRRVRDLMLRLRSLELEDVGRSCAFFVGVMSTRGERPFRCRSIAWATQTAKKIRFHELAAARQQDRCLACYAEDPFVMGVGHPGGRAECRQYEAPLGLPEWPRGRVAADGAPARLQTAVVNALRGQPAARGTINAPNARIFIRVLAELLDLLVDADAGEPVFARVAAAHWPHDLRAVGRPNPESRIAWLPVRCRVLAMAVAAAVMIDPADDADEVLGTTPRHTLAASLTDDEWRRWEQHMVQWPYPIRERLTAARPVSGLM